MPTSRIRKMAATLVAVGLVATACTSDDGGADAVSPDPEAAESTGEGGVVRIGWGGSPDSLNPGNGLLGESYTIYGLVYDTLVSLDLDGGFQPSLATTWSVADDQRTWTLEIVEGVSFHDGEPLTASDVAYSLELWRDNDDFPFLSAYPDVFESIEALDDTTLTITTEEPIGNLESRLVFAFIVPEHIWSAVDDVVAFANDEMIGSGPFRFEEQRQGEYVQLAANPDHWATPPNVAGAIFQTLSNADARVQALRNGDIDMITEMPNTGVAVLRDDPNVTVVDGDPVSPGLRDIVFNVLDPDDCPDGSACTGHPALRDVEVRRALAMAVDKQQTIDVVLLGLGTPGLTFVPTGLGPWFAEGVQDHPFDLDAAAALLEDAGYTDSDGNGIRECRADQDCDDLTFRLNYATDIDTAPREAELLAGWWREIGVAVEIQGLDPDTLTSVCCPNYDHDVFIWGWISDPDPAFLLGVALCSEIDTGFSESGYCNPRYDELFDQQAVETDGDRRIDLVHQMQQILVDDVPFIATYYERSVQAYRNDRFTGWMDAEPLLELSDETSLAIIRPVE